ncbi:hypothetical protein [Myceligenerans crystallogenes]|uniref:Uncharacterized protein n=1 Tax=Myceligenerans crystallogenes TaxID=316335 RepID=A0ABP4ZL90_9MICO
MSLKRTRDALGVEEHLNRRGRRGRRGRGWFTVEVEPGRYARVPAWRSRETFLAAVDEVAARSSWRAPRRASFTRVLGMLAEVADGATGRGVQVSVRTIASRTGHSRGTVFRRLADARRAGLLVDVARGRHTYRGERARASLEVGRRVHRVATTRALTHRPDVVVETPPTPSGVGSSLPSVGLTKRARRARPRPIAVQRLAAGLVARRGMAWADGGRHIGALCGVLESVLPDAGAWTSQDVLGALEGRVRARGGVELGRDARDRLGYLRHALTEAVAAGAVPATVRAVAARSERAEVLARRRAEDADVAARLAATDPAAVAAARASIRASIAAARRAGRAA